MTIVETASKFCNKLWQAARYLAMAHERYEYSVSIYC